MKEKEETPQETTSQKSFISNYVRRFSVQKSNAIFKRGLSPCQLKERETLLNKIINKSELKNGYCYTF